MLLGIAVGTVFIAAHLRRLGWFIIVLAVGELAALCLPPVSGELMAALENRARVSSNNAPHCCYKAIVVLGGGVEAAAFVHGFQFHLLSGADRVVEGANLFRQQVASHIIVSGTGTEAEAMRHFLVALGVPSQAIIVDGNARNTLETAENVRALVPDGRVAFVTSAYHMPRVLQLARRAKINAEGFPTDFQCVSSESLHWSRGWMPSLGSLNAATIALREVIALAFDYRQPRSPPSRPPAIPISSILRPSGPGG
jgi:uncharacterized SAM-binding protein YcdF (DUF218 family)